MRRGGLWLKLAAMLDRSGTMSVADWPLLDLLL
jgi:hypothetical protein